MRICTNCGSTSIQKCQHGYFVHGPDFCASVPGAGHLRAQSDLKKDVQHILAFRVVLPAIASHQHIVASVSRRMQRGWNGHVVMAALSEAKIGEHL